MRVAVLGAGAWGTALSIALAARHPVALWARDARQARAIAATRVNERYLRDFRVPMEVAVEHDLSRALDGAELVIVATTVGGLRETLRALRASGSRAPVIGLCKGFEAASGKLPHEVAGEEIPDRVYAALSGPSFAQEVARGLPAAVTLACADGAFAHRTARELHSRTLRIYSSDDVAGVGVAGAVKNVMAIATGICDGLGLGLNARAALITRGLAEITRLGLAFGGRPETFMGLAGAGDLILTCTGDLSRNRRVGLALARGDTLEQILQALGHVAEGVPTAREVDRIARERGVDMPVTREVTRVLFEGLTAADAVQDLLAREPKSERG